MARRAYFSFHYDRDIIRVSQIRNCGVFKGDEVQPFLDKADWEKIKKNGDNEIKKWIDEQMNGTSVLILCIGYETYKRKWVRYEIRKAQMEKKGIVGIHVHQQKDFSGNRDYKGVNPLDTVFITVDGKEICLSSIHSTYDWIEDNGRENMENWVEKAIKIVGR